MAGAGRVDDAIRLLEAGLAVIPLEQNLSHLYMRLWTRRPKPGWPTTRSDCSRPASPSSRLEQYLSHLYLRCADLMAESGRADDAIRLLEAGFAVIPLEQNLAHLYLRCADLMAEAGRGDDAIRLLEAGLAVIPPEKDLSHLYAGSVRGPDGRGGPGSTTRSGCPRPASPSSRPRKNLTPLFPEAAWT